ncbi:MAG: ATP-dependent DNA helicase [Spirochaetia bacterium]|nr:ATP-dependent DNA helicase [Spirochaetia bacterium]
MNSYLDYETDHDDSIFQPQNPPWLKGKDKADVSAIIQSAFNLLEKSFEKYTPRSSQIEMAENILRNMLNEKVTVLEAGTGIGKSFAYLIAAISYSYLTGKRVLISTETKNLQLQLFEKDLPVLQNALSFAKNEYDLCLGSANYLCRLRYEDVFQKGTFVDLIDKETQKEFHEFASSVFKEGKGFGYIYETEKHFPKSFFNLVCRDSDGCPSNKCIYFSTCNYFKAKKSWSSSRILTGNHHLTLYNFLNDKKTIPTYAALIIDEAHGFIQSGMQIFSLSFSSGSYAEQKKKIRKLITDSKELSPEKVDDLQELSGRIEKNWSLFFSSWEAELNLSFAENQTKIISNEKPVANAELKNNIEEIKNLISEIKEKNDDAITLNSANSLIKHHSQYLSFLERFEKLNFDKNVFWAEKKENILNLKTCHLKLGEEISSFLDEPHTWLSATVGYWPFAYNPSSVKEMTAKGYFNSFIEETLPSAAKENLNLNIHFSPFAYEKNMLLYLPRGIEEPSYNADKKAQRMYEQALLDEIIRLIELSNGGALILFTSHYMLNKFTDILQETIDHEVISQAHYGAEKALSYFRERENAVLLGTNSFWQGIDLPGFALRLVIVVKLMFTPPDDPLFQAKKNLLESQNRKSFFELSLPKAAIMLKQALGRLIRSETDKGVAAILDGRILTKSYGKILLANLPPASAVTDFNELKKLTQEKNIF